MGGLGAEFCRKGAEIEDCKDPPLRAESGCGGCGGLTDEFETTILGVPAGEPVAASMGPSGESKPSVELEIENCWSIAEEEFTAGTPGEGTPGEGTPGEGTPGELGLEVILRGWRELGKKPRGAGEEIETGDDCIACSESGDAIDIFFVTSVVMRSTYSIVPFICRILLSVWQRSSMLADRVLAGPVR